MEKEHPNCLMKASYSGFGWMLIKRGVFEKMNIRGSHPNGINLQMDGLIFQVKMLVSVLKQKKQGLIY